MTTPTTVEIIREAEHADGTATVVAALDSAEILRDVVRLDSADARRSSSRHWSRRPRRWLNTATTCSPRSKDSRRAGLERPRQTRPTKTTARRCDSGRLRSRPRRIAVWLATSWRR
jgi:hypothetical protein